MPLDSVNCCPKSFISCKALNLSELVMVSTGLIPWFPSCMEVVASHLTLGSKSHSRCIAPSHSVDPKLPQVIDLERKGVLRSDGLRSATF